MYGFGNFNFQNFQHFFGTMFAEMDRIDKEKAQKAAGIEPDENSKYGVPTLEIPSKYDFIELQGKGALNSFFYYGFFLEDESIPMVDVYDSNGKFLLTAKDKDFHYINEGFFLIKATEKALYALYSLGEKLTDFIFHSPTIYSKFTKDSEFCILRTDGYKDCVINKKGETVYFKSSYGSISLNGNIISDGNNVINGFTGEIICETYSYRAVLKADNFLFVECDGIKRDTTCVFKINKITCEYEIFGTPAPKKEPKPEPSPVTKDLFKSTPKLTPKTNLNPQRNDLCNCGSGKKFKNCCLGKK